MISWIALIVALLGLALSIYTYVHGTREQNWIDFEMTEWGDVAELQEDKD